jgi:catechol 2,3-dioxygenase-like lactoylglutathione lyase family enzyme
MGRFLTRVILYLAGGACLFAQSPVVGVGTFIHVVANLDKTMQFYGDRLGLELNGAPGPRAFAANAVVENLYDAKGSQSRVAVFKIPGSPLGLEFAEFKDAVQKPFRPRLQDPGASLLSISVGDVGSVMAKLKEDGTPVVREPAVVQDPDGFFIQLREGTSSAKLSLTVDSTDRTLRLFRDLLGFQTELGKSVVRDKRSGSERISSAKIPGTEFEVEFVEYKGGDRKAPAPGVRAPGIHDPGAGVLRLFVRNVDSLLQTLKAGGFPVVSAGGETVSIGARHVVILRDPDNFFVQIFDQPNSAPK